LTGPLPQDMRDKMERTNLCMGCHQEMTNPDVWSAVQAPGFLSNDEHMEVLNLALKALAEQRAEQ
ncbi:MAG: hypothetical protein AAFY56_14035, partial [Pseudomonadota bacterium]